MSENSRATRVAEVIREEIARLLTKGLKDPRIGFVSVMEVRMSPDLRHANVYVSLYGGEAERKSSLIALQNSAGWVRREVGKCLHVHHTPEIRFFPDSTLDRVYQLEEVFQSIHEEQQNTPMLRMTLAEMVEELKTAEAPLVVTHVNPDGDAVGSLLAARLFLRALGKTRVSCAIDGAVPAAYAGLPGAKTILNAESDRPVFDRVVLVDCARLDRIGEIADWIPPAVRVLVLDHHDEEGPPGGAGIIDPSRAAAGELVAALFDAAEIPWDADAATCLYVAQATDTGGYRFASTTAGSHELAARLISAGVDLAVWNERIFNTMAARKFQLLRRVLDRAEFLHSGELAVSWVGQADFAETGALVEDTDGLINYLRQVDGVRVAAFFTERDPGACKVSLRSDASFDSARFLREYGGGGHFMAAGATLDLPLAEALETVTAALETAMANNGTEAP